MDLKIIELLEGITYYLDKTGYFSTLEKQFEEFHVTDVSSFPYIKCDIQIDFLKLGVISGLRPATSFFIYGVVLLTLLVIGGVERNPGPVEVSAFDLATYLAERFSSAKLVSNAGVGNKSVFAEAAAHFFGRTDRNLTRTLFLRWKKNHCGVHEIFSTLVCSKKVSVSEGQLPSTQNLNSSQRVSEELLLGALKTLEISIESQNLESVCRRPLWTRMSAVLGCSDTNRNRLHVRRLLHRIVQRNTVVTTHSCPSETDESFLRNCPNLMGVDQVEDEPVGFDESFENVNTGADEVPLLARAVPSDVNKGVEETKRSVRIIDREGNVSEQCSDKTTGESHVIGENSNLVSDSNVNCVLTNMSNFRNSKKSSQWHYEGSFDIPFSDWVRVKNVESKYNWELLQYVIRESAKAVFTASCVITFTSHRVNKTSKTIFTKLIPVVVYYGKCKFESCKRQFVFKIYESNSLTLKVFSNDEPNHEGGQRSSQLRGYERVIVQEELVKTRPHAFRMNQISQCNRQSVLAGNLGAIRSLEVFQKARSEKAMRGDLHEDDMVDLYAIAKADAKMEKSECFVHDVSYPLKVCMYSTTQLETLMKCLKKNETCVLHVDSTGSVVRPVDKEYKTVYYYAGCTNISGKLLTLMDFVSVQHDITTVTSFFSKFLFFKRKVTTKPLFSHIVIDFSQVLLQSVINAWCKISIDTYLKKMFTFATKQRRNVKPPTVHLCCSHFMHMVSGDLKKLNINGPLKNFILQAMAVLLNCNDFEQFKCKLKHLLTVCLNSNLNQSVLDSIALIDSSGETCVVSDDIPKNDSSFTKESFPLYKKSPFYDVGMSIEKDVMNAIDCESSEHTEKNSLYCPTFSKLFLNRYMPYSPLWSGFVIRHSDIDRNPNCRFSNANVENHFRHVKESVLEHQTNLKVGRFVKLLKERIFSICKELTLHIPKSACNRPTKARKRQRTNKIDVNKRLVMTEDDPNAMEMWAKRQKKGKVAAILLKEPYLAQQLFNKVVNLAVKSMKIQDNVNVGLAQINIEVTVPLIKDIMLFSKRCSPTSSGLFVFRGVLVSCTKPTKYCRSAVYQCPLKSCSGHTGERVFGEKSAGSICCYCGCSKKEYLRARENGDQVLAVFVNLDAFQMNFHRNEGITVSLKDNLIKDLTLGVCYNVTVSHKCSRFIAWGIERTISEAQWRFDHNLPAVGIPQTIRALEKYLMEVCPNSPWALTATLSSQIASHRYPDKSFLQLKTGLLLSLASQSEDHKPVPLLAVGPDCSVLLYCASQLSRRCVSVTSAALCGSLGATAGETWLEAGPLLLASGGVCYLGDWAKFGSGKSSVASQITAVLESGRVDLVPPSEPLVSSPPSLPFQAAVWTFWSGDKATSCAQAQLRTLIEVFGMPFIGDGGADIEVVADHLLYESMQTRTSKVEGAIPEKDLKEYLNIVCSYKVQLTPQAKKLLRNYFVASRRERPDCLPLNALKTLTALAEAHARLCLRTIVTYDDVVLVVFLYEESIAALYGTSLMSPPPSMLGADSSNLTIAEQITLTLKNFSMWLDQYVKSLLSEGSVNCSLPEE